VIVAMLVLTLVLSIMTAIAGSSRTLYQASIDGFLPKFLSRTNSHGSPIPAMWTELVFNLALLLVSNNVFLLALSNVSYLAFIFLNLQAGWIHRLDRPDWSRPFRSPTILLALGAALGFFDIFLIGMGANAYGSGVLVSGLVTIVAIIPVFLYRHYIQDRGVFPAALAADLQPGSDVAPFVSRAGVLPYLALLAGGLLIALGAHLAS
jgi:amino acid transporter